jgi:hypothetical protein
MAEDFQKLIEEQRKTNKLLEQQARDNAKGDDLRTSVKNSAGEIINDILISGKAVKESDETQEKLDDIKKNDGKNYKSASSQRDDMIEKLDFIGGNELSPAQKKEKEKDAAEAETDARKKSIMELGKTIGNVFSKLNPLPKGAGGFLKNLLKLGLGGLGIVMLTNFLKSPDWEKMKTDLIPGLIAIFTVLGKVVKSIGFRATKLAKDIVDPEKTMLDVVTENAGTISGFLAIFYGKALIGFGAMLAKKAIVAAAVIIPKGVIAGFFSSLIAGFGALVSPLLIAVGIAFSSFKGVKSGMDAYKKDGDLGNAIEEGMETFIATILGIIPDLLLDLTGFVLKTIGFEKAGQYVQDISVTNMIEKLLDGMQIFVENLFENIIQGTKRVFDQLTFGIFIPSEKLTQEKLEDAYEAQAKLVESREKLGMNMEKPGLARRRLMLEERAQAKIDSLMLDIERLEDYEATKEKNKKNIKINPDPLSDQVNYKGGKLPKGQISMVGELGPEFVVSKSDAQVFSARKSEKLIMSALNGAISGNVGNLPRNVGGNMSSLNTGNAGGNGGGASIVNTPVNVVNNSSVSNTQNRVVNIVDADPFLARLNTVAI